ncbi:nascent polypeptide-associated complex subunit alpha, muscle-specific form isoform X1 [Hyalella azteca]|uniref:Nascent polypeptide-associated complex subunit alpha, muscle-specific form isoform X1 n=1 Tax=Hyalella azteca TaxID=294128 RepID=A0A8B7NQD1_HYAAZ|nr:nascent polypeptide-associated complex subunit alpha, muscle-specific form isoform X1 [Hyalella azteca]
MPAKVKKTKKKRRMTGLLACLGGCGGKMPRDDFEDITTLDFRHFSLTEVPSDVFACERTLETLYLDSNQLSELPRELFLCHGLRELSVSDNELSSVPAAVANLPVLASLDISKNNLSNIPESIKSCRELARVNVSVNPLCKLPEGFTQLIALKELYLNDTFLEFLPANFGRLVSLEVLELRENQLNTLPKSLARLTKLRTLDIGNNEFSQLPEVVGSLASLQELWFDSNKVRCIAPFLGQLSELTYLDGSSNRIDSLPDDIQNCKKLTDLHLSENHLKTIPDTLCECSSLEVLRLDDNALSCLPSNIGSLSRLTELVVTKNDIEELPPSVGLLRSLHTLHADDNMLESVPSELGSCSRLAVLTLASNKLQALPPEIGHLSTLRVLNVCDNSIRNLPVSFSKLKLRALWLSDNQAKPSVQLQTETDPTTGQKVLTCFMLPQHPSQRETESEKKKDEEPFPMATWEEKHRARSLIKFSFDENELKTGAKLSRAPTPYPKELRALAKHAKSVVAGSKALEGEVVLGRRASHDPDVASKKPGALAEDNKRKSAPCVLTPSAQRQQESSAVTAQYHAAVADKTSVDINDAVVKTANKTSPSSVMETTAAASSAFPKDGFVPAAAGHEEHKEGRTTIQSQTSADTNQALASARGSCSPVSTLNNRVTASSVPSTTPELSSPVTSSPSKAALSIGLSAVTATSSTSVVTLSKASSVTTSPSHDMSDDDATADVLAEALELADRVAEAPYKNSATEDAADQSSTDSGYCRPSHPTSSQCDLSDQSSELISPTPSLPSETVSPKYSGSRHGSLSRASPALSYEGSPAHSQQPNIVNPNVHHGLASSAYTVNLPANPPSSQFKTVPSPSSVMPLYPAMSPHELPLKSPAIVSSSALQDPTAASTNIDGSSWSSSRTTSQLGEVPEELPTLPVIGSPHRSGQVPCQPRPGSLALASLADSGVLSDRAGYLARPGSLAAPCNTLGIPPAPPTRAVSAATGLNHTNRPPSEYDSANTARSPHSSELHSPAHHFASSVSSSPYAPVIGSKIPSNTSTHRYGDCTSPPNAGYSVSSGASRGKQSASRIPTNRQSSSTLVGGSNDTSRIPSYNSPHIAKSANDGSKIAHPGNFGGAVGIQSHASAGRSYSSLSTKSNISYTSSSGEQHLYRNTPADSRLPVDKESRIPSVLDVHLSNGNRGPHVPSAPGSRIYSPSATSPPAASPHPMSPPAASQHQISGTPGTRSGTGIPMPGFTRSNSGTKLKDARGTAANVDKSGIATNGGSKSHLPLSPNSSFDSGYRAAPLSRIPSVGSYSVTGAPLSPVNEAINTSGLPPPPPSAERPSGLQQPKISSRIPQMGAPVAASGQRGARSPPSTGDQGPPSAHPPSKARSPGSGWMFGSHQNARVFPVIIEKQPAPGFTIGLLSEPEKVVVVTSVEPGGPASAALAAGDKLLQADGETLTNAPSHLLSALMAPNGDTLSLLVSRAP